MKIIDKIFRDKKANTLIYIILAVGILMLVCANSFSAPSDYHRDKTETVEVEPIEQEAEQILSKIDGVGKADVMISYENAEKTNQIRGVLVVAEGGGDYAVKEKIIRALRAALGTDVHKIEVFERKE